MMLTRSSLLSTDQDSSSSTRSEMPTQLKVQTGPEELIHIVQPHAKHLHQAKQLVVGRGSTRSYSSHQMDLQNWIPFGLL